MDRDACIRELRQRFAEAARRATEWNDTAALAKHLADRRYNRRMRRKLFAHPTFHRLVSHFEDGNGACGFVTDLEMLRFFLSNQMHPDEIKEFRKNYLQAKLEVESAARVLRLHARAMGKGNRQVLMDAAREIENAPWYAIDDSARGLAIFVDFGLFGQKGDARAYAIRNIDRFLPATIHNRDSMIRDFLELIGIDATSALVRSTLLNGRT
jgi:hypothetical protein